MKKSFIILIAGLIIYGCGGQTKEKQPQQKDQFAVDTSDLKAAPVENPNQEYFLRYKLAKGNTYNFRLTAISKDDQTISSKDSTINQAINQTMIYNVGLNVTDVDADSTMELKAEINSIKVDGNAGAQQLNYQSGVTKDTAEIDKYAQYESLVNNPFYVRVSKYGELLDVYRADGIVNKLLDIRGYTDSLKSEEKTTLKNDITEGVLKPLLSQIFRKLPENKVSKDSTWKIEQPASRLMVFEVHNTSVFKITSTKKLDDELIADIDAGLKTNISGENKLSQQGVNYEFQNPKTSGRGKIYFNVSKGLIQKTKISTSVEIAFNMESRGEKGNKKEVITTTNILEYLP
ncbi:MAG TPA: DUF6263 family protein [Ignavibacteriaceae bacterium]|nr:DUF6263 family protein [Ignavibacteriaceae bacterium]